MTIHPNESFNIETIDSKLISPTLRQEIIALCNRAYQEDLTASFETYLDPVHILEYYDGILVSHALWVTRYLQAGTNPAMLTAYVEVVATEAKYRNRGFAASLMKHLTGEIQNYDLAALSPFSVAYYRRLGWELWLGPLFIRSHDMQRIPSPADEEVMIFRLPKTPALDLNAPLSAEWRDGELW
jgi:aminoglycoside 2'-N-acetyltransferase I